ncbi:MAG: MFS transporter [Candidatus Sericytochromatia bacterium]
MEQANSSNKKWLIAIIVFAMYVSFGMSWMSVIPIRKEILEALAIDAPKYAVIISSISLAKSVFPIIAGILATKIGISNTLRLSSLLISLGIITPWLPDYYEWIVSRFLFGVGGAMWVTLMGAVTMQIFEPEKRPVINSINGIAVNLGVVIALWYTNVLSASFGWKTTMSMYSIVSIVLAVLFWAMGQIGPVPQKNTNNENKEVKTEDEFTYFSTLKLPVTWLISVAFTGPLALYLVFNTWLPIYYEETLQISKLTTLNYIIMMNVWGIPSAVITGLLIQKIKKCKPFLILASILLPIVSFYSVKTSDASILPFTLALTGVGMFLSVSPLTTLLQNQPKMNPKIIGMILGTMFSVTYIISSAVPSIVGYFYALKYDLGSILAFCSLIALSPAVALKLSENK